MHSISHISNYCLQFFFLFLLKTNFNLTPWIWIAFDITHILCRPQTEICQALWSRGSIISRRGWTILQFTSSCCVKLNYIWTVFQFIGYKCANVSQRSTSVTILFFSPQFNFCCLNSLQIYHPMLVSEVFNKLFVVKYSLFVKMHEYKFSTVQQISVDNIYHTRKNTLFPNALFPLDCCSENITIQ